MNAWKRRLPSRSFPLETRKSLQTSQIRTRLDIRLWRHFFLCGPFKNYVADLGRRIHQLDAEEVTHVAMYLFWCLVYQTWQRPGLAISLTVAEVTRGCMVDLSLCWISFLWALNCNSSMSWSHMPVQLTPTLRKIKELPCYVPVGVCGFVIYVPASHNQKVAACEYISPYGPPAPWTLGNTKQPILMDINYFSMWCFMKGLSLAVVYQYLT